MEEADLTKNTMGRRWDCQLDGRTIIRFAGQGWHQTWNRRTDFRRRRPGNGNRGTKSPGVIKFSRSMPISNVLQPKVIIAYQMNGRELSVEHGFPVRAIIPGWYGMASVKWLTKITATATPYDGCWQTLEYAYWTRKAGLPTLTPVTTLQIKAEISRPVLHKLLTAGSTYRVFGAAWVGENKITKVEVSADEGKTWNPRKLLDQAVPNAWQLWEYNWNVPAVAGRYKLMARATDQKGNTQPEHHDPDRRTYMVNFMAPVEVEVA